MCACSSDHRGSIADTPEVKELLEIFKKAPSEKTHRKAIHTWKDIGIFEVDKLITDSKIILNEKYTIAKLPSE